MACCCRCRWWFYSPGVGVVPLSACLCCDLQYTLNKKFLTIIPIVLFLLTISNGRRHPRQLQVRPAARSVCLGLRSACAAQHCLRAAGPRAIPSTVADEPGPLGYLLFVNVLAVPASLLARVVCRVEVSGFVLCASRVGSVCMCC